MNSRNQMSDHEAPEPNIVRRCWSWLWRPAPTTALATLVGGGIIVGVLLWGAFNWAMELTNTEQFCISCHEMKVNVYAEYRNTIHFANRSGVRAVCSDCHVPKEWQHKVIRKIYATNELFHHFLGSVSTPDKFNNKRLQLAVNEWARMKRTDSHECRNCHDFNSMDYATQEPRASRTHQEGLKTGRTCIDCHRGIAHKLPPNANEAYQKLVESMASGDRKTLADYLDSLAPAALAAPTNDSR